MVRSKFQSKKDKAQQLADFERFNPENPEEFRRHLREDLLVALENGQPINIDKLIEYDDKPAIGDTITSSSACYIMLRELLGEKAKTIKLSTKQGYPLGKRIGELHPLFATNDNTSRVAMSLELVADTLGLPVPKDAVKQPPVVLPLEGYKPLEGFDYQKVLLRAEELAKEFGNQEIILVCQAGSQSYKRFSDEQFNEILQYMQAKHRDKKIIPLRDKDIKDINELAAYCYLAKDIVTTDTSWSWIAGSVRQLQQTQGKQSSDLIVFHPISSSYWHVPGSDSIYGPATKFTSLDDDRSPGLLLDFQYKNYAQGKDIWDFDRSEDDKFSTPIIETDFRFFMNELKKRL